MNAFSIGRALADLHPILVHAPIVLWPCALLADLLLILQQQLRAPAAPFWSGGHDAQPSDLPPCPVEEEPGALSSPGAMRAGSAVSGGGGLLICGSVIALLAFLCGIYAETFAARAGRPTEPMEAHELAAIATTWWFIALTVLRLLYQPTADRRGAAWLLALLAGCLALTYTAHLGGKAVYDCGIAVQNVSHAFKATPEDLQILAMQQPLKGILYSDWMHHIFGWVVLAVAALVARGRSHGSVLGDAQRLLPWMFGAGGIFLWIFSDWDAWPLSDELPITDKEVLLHKVIASLMLVFAGVLGRTRKHLGLTLDDARERRVLAIFGIIGGALMLTHIHSVAPYSNVALGVYLHHTVLGGLALLLGASQLGSTAWSPLRAAMPVLMAALGLVLISYNEGLPWYLGNVAHPRPGPQRGQIAQVGERRAELTFDASTQALEVQLWDLHQDIPAPARLQQARLVIEHEGTTTLLPLEAAPGPLPGSRWRARAAYLRGAQTFLPQLLATDEQGRALRGDFDPWVAPVIAWFDPSGRPAPYVCPMHPQEGAREATTCRICHMQLVPNRGDGGSQATEALQVTPTQATAGRACSLRFAPRNQQTGRPTELAVVHERPLHLMVVSQDLTWFDHVHPALGDDGDLTLDYTFPHGGEFVLFSELTPLGGSMQCFRTALQVAGSRPEPQPLRPREAQAVVVGDSQVTLRTWPIELRHGSEAVLAFHLARQGQGITDLEPFLGARGHLAAIDESLRGLLHSHPVEEPTARFGPDVAFHVRFPTAGRYKVWGQFQRAARTITAGFVLEVR